MSIKTLEQKVEAYAKAIGKDIEHVYDEVVAYIEGKHAAAVGNPTAGISATAINANGNTGLGSVPQGQIDANQAATAKTVA